MANIKAYDSFKNEDGEEIYLYQAINEKGEWNNKYERHPIFCPECGIAYLKFTSKTANHCAFLSSMPIPPYPEHSNDCSHQYATIGKQGAKDFYNTCTHEQAIDKINACINLLKRQNHILAIADENQHLHQPSLTVEHSINGRRESRRLRTRSFYSIYKLEDEDIGFPIVFYGKAYLSCESKKSKSKGYDFNVLKVRSIYKDNRTLQSIYFGNNTIDNLREDHIYLFAMIGVPVRKGNFINVNFYNNDYSLYRIEEPD